MIEGASDLWKGPTMSLTITCPSCSQSLRSDRPITPGMPLRCPQCQSSFMAQEVKPEGSRQLGPMFWAVSVGALILGGAIVTAAVMLSGRGTPPPTPSDDAEARKKLEEEQNKLEADRKAFAAEKARAAAADLVRSARKAVEDGKLEEAEKLFDEALKLAPGTAEAERGLLDVRVALRLRAQSDTEAGKREAERSKLVDEGKAALLDKKYAQAASLLKAALAIAPTDRAALTALAEAEAALKADEDEKRKLKEYTDRLAAAKLAFDGGRFADAAREYAAAKLLMDTPEARAGLRQAEGRMAGDADLARKQKQLEALLEEARASKARLMFQSALDTLDRAVRLAPDDRDVARMRRDVAAALADVKAANAKRLAAAKAALEEGRFDDAIRQAGDAARAWPEDRQAPKLLKQAEDASETYRSNQVRYLAAIQSAELAMASARFADAVVAYNEALKYNPLNADIQRALRNAILARDRDIRNKAEYERQLRLGNRALAAGNWAEARVAFQAAAKLLPDDLAAKEGLRAVRYGKAMEDGNRALTLKSRAAALAAFQAALEERPGDLKARQGLELAKKLK
jgi:tetratricopeptide (TPR) repeat protein